MPNRNQEYEAISLRVDALVSRGRQEEAKSLLQQALLQARAGENKAFISYFEGELAYLQKDYERALELYKRSNQLHPGSPFILRATAVTLAKLKRYEQALQWFDHALAVRPRDCDTLGDRGATLTHLGRFEESLEWFDRALALRPDDHNPLRERGMALVNLGRFDDGLAWLDRALAAEPEDYDSHRNRGFALTNLHRFDDALESFNKTLTIASHDFEALRGKAIVIGFMGRGVEAVELLRQCLDKNPEDIEAMLWLIRFADNEEARHAINTFAHQQQILAQGRVKIEQDVRDRKLKHDAWRSLSARSAHRIGNQLFAARGAVRTLRKMRDPAALEAVADLEGALNRIRRIVREFQTFGKAEPPHLRPTRIGIVIEQVVRRYRNMSIDTQWTIHLSRRLPFCRLDQDQIEQALGELLENAIYHTPTGGQIFVAARAVRSRKPPGIRITAENTGSGVPDADKERIFEPFVSTRPGGTGLGLAIVKQIVEQHGGTVRETGRPGKGARFEIELPAVQKSEAKP